MHPTAMFYPRGSFPPVSNTERQRQFRKRNPGYYGRLHAKRRAASKARVAAAQATAVAAPEIKVPLMLPAPVEIPIIPGINAIAEMPAPAPVPMSLPIGQQQAERSIAA